MTSCKAIAIRLAAGAALLVAVALASPTAGAAGTSPAASRASLPALAVSHASAHVVQRQPPPDSCRARGSGEFSRPDPRCTPGAIDAAVRQSTIRYTICRSGYTRTVRPSESITNREKRASMAAYGDGTRTSAFEYDHLVPLELGGAANDARNLWPEPGASPNPKDALENRLHRLVCTGSMRLATAQRAIAHDWIGLYRQLYG